MVIKPSRRNKELQMENYSNYGDFRKKRQELHKAGVRYDKHLKEVTQGDKRCS